VKSPTLGLGAIFASLRAGYRQLEFRRQVKLTVEHERNRVVMRTASALVGSRTDRRDFYVVTVTNMSPRREIVVRRVWFATTPEQEVNRADRPVRIRPEDFWRKDVPADTVPGEPEEVLLLARCQLAPDDRIIESSPA
jgi:hypothetical protein